MIEQIIDDALNLSANASASAREERAILEVDIGAIKHNLSIVRELCPASRVMAVLKGDAYGLGAVEISRALKLAGVEGIAVDNVAEGIDLRQAGIEGLILLLDGCLPMNADLAIRYELTPGISSHELLLAYDAAARKVGKKLSIWLGYNCGFNRSGYRSLTEFELFLAALKSCDSLDPVALYSHLPASHNDLAETERQRGEHDAALNLARSKLNRNLDSSLFASHGILALDGKGAGEWVRPGILLYGSACFEKGVSDTVIDSHVSNLRPALSLRARIIHKLKFEADQYCGLGQKYKAKKGQILATMAIGFGNGLPAVTSRSDIEPFVASQGQKFPLVTVGMDYSQIELANEADVELYDWVTLFGDPNNGKLSIVEFAASLGMSVWVLVRQLNVPRKYVEN